MSKAHTPGTKGPVQVQQGTLAVGVAGQPVTLEAHGVVAFAGAGPGSRPEIAGA